MRKVSGIELDKFDPGQVISMTSRFTVISAGNVQEKLMVWIEYDDDPQASYPGKGINFMILNTGDLIPEGYEYVSTVILHGGVYVRHVYVSKT